MTFLTVLVFPVMIVAQEAQQAYIGKYKELAFRMMHQYGIPASVLLGIAIEESASGTSVLAKRFHNHFGIVGRNYNAVKKLGHHTRYKEYVSDTASYIHFCEVIRKKPLYDTLQGRLECVPWVKAIKKSGYAAAATSWEKKVLLIIRRNNLEELDRYMPDPLNDSIPSEQ